MNICSLKSTFLVSQMNCIAVLFAFTNVNLTANLAFAQSVNESDEYKKKVEEISKVSEEKRVSAEFLRGQNWVGRIALINIVCGSENSNSCKKVLNYALLDNALVVRDHALRIYINQNLSKESEKLKALNRIISDDRNYRKGKPLWIVHRAQNYIHNIK